MNNHNKHTEFRKVIILIPPKPVCMTIILIYKNLVEETLNISTHCYPVTPESDQHPHQIIHQVWTREQLDIET